MRVRLENQSVLGSLDIRTPIALWTEDVMGHLLVLIELKARISCDVPLWIVIDLMPAMRDNEVRLVCKCQIRWHQKNWEMVHLYELMRKTRAGT